MEHHLGNEDDSGSEPDERPVSNFHNMSEAEENLGSDPGSSSSASEEEQDPGTKDMPLGQLLQQQQDSLAPSSQHWRASSKSTSKLKSAGSKRLKRANKNRPAEQSSKRPVPRLREVVQAPSRKSRDPRFDDMAGTLRDEVFKKRFSFLFDEQLPLEKAELKKAVKKTKSQARKKELQREVTRIEQQIWSVKDQQRKQEAEVAAKAKEKEAVKAGKKPFFPKKSEKKRQELIRRYEELKATGRLQKVLTKKRKKNAAKDHRYIPSTRREEL